MLTFASLRTFLLVSIPWFSELKASETFLPISNSCAVSWAKTSAGSSPWFDFKREDPEVKLSDSLLELSHAELLSLDIQAVERVLFTEFFDLVTGEETTESKTVRFTTYLSALRDRISLSHKRVSSSQTSSLNAFNFIEIISSLSDRMQRLETAQLELNQLQAAGLRQSIKYDDLSEGIRVGLHIARIELAALTEVLGRASFIHLNNIFSELHLDLADPNLFISTMIHLDLIPLGETKRLIASDVVEAAVKLDRITRILSRARTRVTAVAETKSMISLSHLPSASVAPEIEYGIQGADFMENYTALLLKVTTLKLSRGLGLNDQLPHQWHRLVLDDLLFRAQKMQSIQISERNLSFKRSAPIVSEWLIMLEQFYGLLHFTSKELFYDPQFIEKSPEGVSGQFSKIILIFEFAHTFFQRYLHHSEDISKLSASELRQISKVKEIIEFLARLWFRSCHDLEPEENMLFQKWKQRMLYLDIKMKNLFPQVAIRSTIDQF